MRRGSLAERDLVWRELEAALFRSLFAAFEFAKLARVLNLGRGAVEDGSVFALILELTIGNLAQAQRADSSLALHLLR